jgi:hypothetical protein
LDKTMTTVMADYPNHHPVEPDIEHVYTDVDDIICEIGIWQNYLSGCIFKKAEWDEIVRREGVEKITSYRHFTHSYVLACMTVDHPHWVWIPDKIVNYRSDNDAFYAVGYTLGRFVAEINDDIRRQFKDTLGTNSRGYRKVMKSMYELWYCPHQLRRWRLDPRNTYADDWYMRVSFTKAGFFVKHFWLNAFPRLIVPLPLLRLRYGFGPFLEKTMGPAHASVRTAARSMVNTARAVPKALAPRTRLRAALRQLNIENGWTQRYDAHVEHALELARRYETGLAHEMVFEPHYASGPESAQSIVARATSNGAGGPVIHFSSGEPDLLGAGDDNDRPETIKRVGNAD